MNGYWRHPSKGPLAGRSLISQAGRNYRQAALTALARQSWERWDEGQRVRLTAVAMPPDRRRRDLDNLPKAVLDALVVAGVLADDSQLDDNHWLRGEVVKGGRVCLWLSPLEEGQSVTSGRLLLNAALDSHPSARQNWEVMS